MKVRFVQNCGLALMLVSAPFIGGCDEERANSAPVAGSTTTAVTSQPPDNVSDTQMDSVSTTDPDQPAPSEADQELADAPGTIISTPENNSTNTSNNPQLADFVKLVQAGVGESVLTAYVTNSPAPFNISSDDILYLNDLGTPETVVTAMLQRDQQFNSNPGAGAAAMTAQAQPAYTNPPQAPVPYTDQNTISQTTEDVPPLTPSADVEAQVQQAPNTSYSYFYDSLSPYGNWINIEGYGACWQPTAVVANPGWQPYCDRGHWAYTDCGWCWVSDYSWGWAPFHYGRWFHNSHRGWCWAPDTVWGPSWVSWRYNNSYCGWAPLPPSACYRPGFGFTYLGRSVGFNFGFGIGVNNFTFVPLNHFHDRSPSHYRMEHREVTRIYNSTTINNRIVRGGNNTLINTGVPVDRVAAASHTDIRPIRIRADADAPRSTQLGRDGRSLSVYRPALPTPRTAVAPRLAGEGVQRDPQFNLHSHVARPEVTRNPVATPTPDRRPVIPNSTASRPIGNPGRNDQFNQPDGNGPNSLIMRGPNRPDRGTARNTTPAPSTAADSRRNPVFQPQTQNPPNAPSEGNRRSFNPPTQQPAQQNQQNFNRADNDQRRIDMDQQRQQREMLQQQQREAQQQVQVQQRQILQQQREVQQQQQQQQREFQQRQFQPQPSYSTPRQEAPPRAIESRPAPEVRSAPQQPSAPARQDNGGGGGRNGGNGGGGNGNNNNNGNGNGGGGRNR
jgi:hypothetical protein